MLEINKALKIAGCGALKSGIIRLYNFYSDRNAPNTVSPSFGKDSVAPGMGCGECYRLTRGGVSRTVTVVDRCGGNCLGLETDCAVLAQAAQVIDVK